ncbi:lipoprotein [Dasania sp. GY-MA-18]|uniref:Lipoprotein n=1 Tax=Dasania phycosphaerae TaxID=2950436 RepID=A0A9J6RKL0_9GAMM|nr:MULTISPECIES: lipoprotein [Dasania]MCR8922510.1 lipoprotein [Dasania sp. GY-MA-18]MCZ0864938.1 lipoprotein [Dasania phycosphaerae]MCZ0868666.1 lipoprotein [Dasania phycosphaerae]
MRLPALYLSISLLLLLAGCGQKGPLFLPSDQPPAQASPELTPPLADSDASAE